MKIFALALFAVFSILSVEADAEAVRAAIVAPMAAISEALSNVR